MTGQQPVPGVTPTPAKLNTAEGLDRPRYWLIAGVAFALVGAVLIFALEDGDASALGVKLQTFGGILFSVGVLLIAAAGVQSLVGGENNLDANGIKSVGGLIAVVTGIIAVTTLALVTTQAGSLNKDAVVAITSSAFGIISTVIGAYLGIKISSEASTKTNETLQTVARENTPGGDSGGT